MGLKGSDLVDVMAFAYHILNASLPHPSSLPEDLHRYVISEIA
jgi:hypothetical protein